MIPTAIVLPAAVPPGILGVLIDPSTVMAALGSVAVVGVVGLCVALMRDSLASRRKPVIEIVRRERIAA